MGDDAVQIECLHAFEMFLTNFAYFKPRGRATRVFPAADTISTYGVKGSLEGGRKICVTGALRGHKIFESSELIIGFPLSNPEPSSATFEKQADMNFR